MDHSHYSVDLVDATGVVVAQKLRSDINKRIDVYHSVHTLLVTPTGEVVLSLIPERMDLQNIYAGQLGATAATIRRSEETADQAALRSLSKELFIDNVRIFHLGDQFHQLQDDHKTFLSAYYLVGTAPVRYSTLDSGGFTTVAANNLRRSLTQEPLKYTPIFRAFWDAYKDQLPI
jgi:hypothetical protein